MVDADGFRSNVGIILTNDDKQVFLARRAGQQGWQFPQGGIKAHEDAEQALYRELYEEIGLAAADVDILAQSQGWLEYRLPERYVRRHQKPVVIGQRQKWFLLRLVADENSFNLTTSAKPEFDSWRWVDYWAPVDEIIEFKREVYQQALTEFATVLFEVEG